MTSLRTLTKATLPAVPAYYVQAASPDTAHSADLQQLEESRRKTAEGLKNAVESIPAYVGRSCMLLVLVPPCMHRERREACCFASWRLRGWCRMELQAAFLKCGTIHIMVCAGAEATPFFLFPNDVWDLLAGEGHFTCCQRQHVIEGAPIPCDKGKVCGVIESMFAAKVEYYERLGKLYHMRFLTTMHSWLCKGLPHTLAESGTQP